jgi:hypothetical protein
MFLRNVKPRTSTYGVTVQKIIIDNNAGFLGLELFATGKKALLVLRGTPC